MGWLAKRKSEKKLGEFIADASMFGGAFLTASPPDAVLGWFRSSDRVEVITADDEVVSAHPVSSDGTVGDETVAVRAQATGSGTHVTILLVDDPVSDGTLNLYAMGPVTYLLAKVDHADPGWRRA